MLNKNNKVKIATVTTSAPCRLTISAFVAHHLSMGIDQIYLYVDGQDDKELEKLFFSKNHVKLIFCDDKYWQNVHKMLRPPDHRKRQVLNANHALARTQADFIAHIDIDEFIVFNASIDKILNEMHSGCIGLRLLPCEAIYPAVPRTHREAYSSFFKKRISSAANRTRLLNELHGEFGGLLEQGLQGHHVGKVLVRNVEGLKLGLHFPSLGDKPLEYQQTDGVDLLHFVCQGPADWLGKYTRRLCSSRFVHEKPVRKAQWMSILEAASKGEEELWKLYLNLNIYDNNRLEKLRSNGLLVERNLDLPAKAEELLNFPINEFEKILPEFNMNEILKKLEEVKQTLAHDFTSESNLASPAGKANRAKRKLMMQPSSIIAFEEKLRASKVYLEYGSGASTVRACELGVPEVHTVETSRDFLDGVINDCATIYSKTKIISHFVDIGPTRAWGYPVSSAKSGQWPAYCSLAWEALHAEEKNPDLILVDGRFRISAFLYSLMMCEVGATILFDDYLNRPRYHLVEKIINPIAMHGRMAEFRKAEQLNTKTVLPILISAVINPH